MKKSITKRIRITRTGKIMRRKMGVNHFRAKKNAGQIRRKRLLSYISSADAKKIIQYITR